MRQIAFATVGIIVVSLVSYVLANLKPAAPVVEGNTVWEDTVKRGPMVRDVRGLGTLVPEDIRWIPATTQGRVERIVLRPGTPVKPDSVILELSNPQLEQELRNAELQLQSAEASLANLRVQVQNDLLSQRATAASIEADYKRADMQVQMNEALAKDQLISQLQLKQSQLDSEQLSVRNKIAPEQLASRADSARAQLAVQQAAVDQARAVVDLRRREHDELKVRAGIDGVLQVIPPEIADGARVAPGANLARVANPSRLKAEIKVAETQARDIQIGQRAEIDTRISKIMGHVVRIDPSVQNGTRRSSSRPMATQAPTARPRVQRQR